MILFLAGVPGIGKTTLARSLLATRSGVHIEFDRLRFALGAKTTTDPGTEDAVNWRAYTHALDAMRAQAVLCIVDSTGISRRLPYLRQALGDYPQKLILLSSAYPLAACARKWGTRYSPAQCEHFLERLRELPIDHELWVDHQSVEHSLHELLALL